MNIPRMDIKVTSAKNSERDILANLLNLYLHDFSEFDDVDIEPDGTFAYPYLDHYWEDPNRYPFIIRADGTLAGFALIRILSEPRTGESVIEMSEFFVIRRLRRSGVGTAAARRLWDLFVGNWQVDVMAANVQALPFWRLAVEDYSEGAFTEERTGTRANEWTSFRFVSGRDVELPDDLDGNVLDY
ncbi:MAG: GNAT family N-acetyltransferase [Gammaproteobacteria bacterium]|nr:GNAT family N-acetyltransferase [Gammaproteobacteria bacterium]